MSVSKHFESPRTLLGRALKHIDELNADLRALIEGDNSPSVVETDPQTKEQVYSIRLPTITSDMQAVAKDAISNLRDTLDHAVYGAAVAIGKLGAENTKFPFSKDAKDLAGRLTAPKSDCRDLPPEIHPFLMSLRPYPTGDDLLVGLNRARNPNTHRIIIPFGTVSNMVEQRLGSFVGVGSPKLGYSRWVPEKNQVEYMRLGAGSKLLGQNNARAFVKPVFGDIDFLKGRYVLPTFRELHHKITVIVNNLEIETLRITAAQGSNFDL